MGCLFQTGLAELKRGSLGVIQEKLRVHNSRIVAISLQYPDVRTFKALGLNIIQKTHLIK